MSELFLKIVNMSISASWLVLVVLLLRLVLKKAPRWVSVLLWGFVAIRLICPFSLESVFSLIPSAETVSPDIMTDPTPQVNTGIDSINSVINPIVTETFTPEVPASMNPLQLWISLAALVWGIGIAAMLIYTTVSYLLLRRKVTTAVRLKNNIFQSENVDSPFVLGIIKPKIYLPFQIDDEPLEYVIAHEESHIRRKDHWWKPFGFVLLAIHWFNPLMWLGYILLSRDIELACDEKVIKEMDNENKANYMEALVSCSVNRRSIAACPLAFGEVGIKERVKSVMNYRKPTFWITVASAVICYIVIVCFLTNPVSNTLQTIEDYQLSIPSEDTQVYVSEGNAYFFAGTVEKAQVQELYDLRLSRREISKDRGEDRDKTHSLMLNADHSDNPTTSSYLPGIHFHFNGDFTHVWVDDGVKPTLSYKVRKPEEARKIYERIAKNAVSADPPNSTAIETTLPADVIIINTDTGEIIYRGEKESLALNETITIENGSDGTVYAKDRNEPVTAAEVVIIDSNTGEVLYGGKDGIKITEVITAGLKTYFKLSDDTWLCKGQHYQYRLEISGRMPNAAVDSTFVYLSNLKNISFARAWRAAGLSSSLEDYFKPEEAVLVDWINDNPASTGVANDNTLVNKPESKLDAAISNAILSHHKSEKPDGLLNTESHIILVDEIASGTPLAGQTGHIREETVYVYYLCLRFNVQGDQPEEHNGMYGQAAITFTVDENGKYTLKHFVKPESSVDSGADYSAELKNKFVAASEDIAEHEEKYAEQLLDSCWATATDYIKNRKSQTGAQHGGNGSESAKYISYGQIMEDYHALQSSIGTMTEDEIFTAYAELFACIAHGTPSEDVAFASLVRELVDDDITFEVGEVFEIAQDYAICFSRYASGDQDDGLQKLQIKIASETTAILDFLYWGEMWYSVNIIQDGEPWVAGEFTEPYQGELGQYLMAVTFHDAEPPKEFLKKYAANTDHKLNIHCKGNDHEMTMRIVYHADHGYHVYIGSNDPFHTEEQSSVKLRKLDGAVSVTLNFDT